MRNLIVTSIVVLACACGEPGTGGTGGGSGGGGGAGGGSSGSTCTTATLFAGNPLHDEPMLRPADGTGLLQDPPLLYRQVVFSNGQLITHVGQELWRASLSDKILHKVAGTEGNQALITGPCAQARFANIFHIAVASDGSLFVSDQTANGLLKVTDPLGDKCTVTRWAGVPKDIDSGLSPSRHTFTGNVDGPGDKARFGTIERLAIDPKDNVYAWDSDNESIRKIANDELHTVTTLVKKVPEKGSSRLVSLAFMGGRVWAWGFDGSNLFLAAWDAEGKKAKVLEGRGDLFDMSGSLNPGALATDGTSLLVSLNGRVFRVSATGEVAELAGADTDDSSHTKGYDPKAPHPAAKVQLPAANQNSTAGLSVFLAVDSSSDVYVSARSRNNYVVKLDCTP